MKRTRLALVAMSALLLLLLLPIGTAAATGNTTNSVSIQYDAQYDLLGSIIHVDLNVRCRGNGTVPGQVEVMVTQEPPETPYPMAAGSGLNNVVCDGRTHSAAVSIIGEGFDAGRASATATLIPPLGGGRNVTSARTINIVAMD